MTQVNTTAHQDPLVAFQMELQQERDRLRRYAKDKLPPDDPRQQLYTEMDSTLLSFQVDMTKHMIYVRDWLYGQLQDEIGALEERLDGIEEPATQFTAEDASDFSDLCDGAELLAKESTWKDKKKKEEFITLIAKCRQTIEDGVLEEDEEEGDEEEETEVSPSPEIQTIGGDEAQS